MPARSTLVIALVVVALAGCSSGTERVAGTGEAAPSAPALENGSYIARLNGFDIHYEVHGTGPALMTVPNSWGLSLEALREMYRPLEARLTMVYFDPRGMGRSGPVVRDEDMGLEAVRDDLDALRQHLGLDRVHAIGWSNGATNLLFLAIEKPDILESAILVHGSARYGPEEEAAFADSHPELVARFRAFLAEMADESLTDGDRTARQRELWLGEYFPAISADPARMREVLARAFADAELSWRHAGYNQRSVSSYDLLGELPGIGVRCLVVAGAHDAIPVEAAERMRDGIPGAELVRFGESGHFAPLEEPEKFRDTVFRFVGVL